MQDADRCVWADRSCRCECGCVRHCQQNLDAFNAILTATTFVHVPIAGMMHARRKLKKAKRNKLIPQLTKVLQAAAVGLD